MSSFSGDGLVNGGVVLFQRSALEGLPATIASLEKDLLPGMKGAIYGCVFDVPFVDIGLPEDWRAAANIIT